MIFSSFPVLVIFWRCLLAPCFCQLPLEPVAFPFVIFTASASSPRPGPDGSDPVAVSDADWPARPEPLDPLKARDEFDVDRLHATALFAEARLLQQRGDKMAALRKYERSWRYHPHPATLRELVAIALELKRFHEAADYVLLDKGHTEFGDRTLLTLATSQANRKHVTAQLYRQWLQGADEEANDQLYTLVRMESGRLCYELAEYERAAEEFHQVLKILDGKSPRKLSQAQQASLLKDPQKTFQMMAATLLKLGQLTEAESLYRRADSRVPNPAQLSRQLARIELLKGNFESAGNLLDQSLAKDRDGRSLRDAFRLQSEIQLSAGIEEQQVSRELAKAVAAKLEKIPDPELAVFYAQQLRRAKEFQTAVDVLESEIVKTPFPSAAHRELIELHAERNDAKSLLTLLAGLCDEPSQLKDVSQTLNSIGKQDKLGQMLLELAQQDIPAEASIGDEHVRQAVVGGLTALELGQFDIAEALLSRVGQHSLEFADELSQIQAVRLAAAGQHAAAGKILRSLIDHTDQEDTIPHRWYLLAGHLEMAGEFDGAVAAIESALNSQPQSPMLRFRLGWIHYRAKHYRQAEMVYRKLLDDFQSSHDDSLLTTLRSARMILSDIAAELNSPVQSQEWLEQVLDESPRDPAALNDLGYQWIDRGEHLLRGMSMIENAMTLDPDNLAYRDSLGWALFRLGRVREAITVLEKAASADQANGVLLRHLGEAYAADRQRQQALAAWRKSIKLLESAGATTAAEKVQQLIDETTTE